MNIKCVSLLIQQEIQSLYEVGTAFIPFENIGYPGKKPVFSARLRQIFICTQLERLQVNLTRLKKTMSGLEMKQRIVAVRGMGYRLEAEVSP